MGDEQKTEQGMRQMGLVGRGREEGRGGRKPAGREKECT